MAHYVAKPNKKSLKYYIFSTVTMSPISPKMYRAEMLEYLKANDYECYLDPRSWIEQDPKWYNADNPHGREIIRMTEEGTYWNGSFWYVTEEDGYFV